MSSIIFQAAARVLVPILGLFSLYLLVRGHNNPGGGFIGGLVVASALGLHAMAFSADDAKALLRLAPERVIGLGLLIAIGTGAVVLLGGEDFLKAKYVSIDLGVMKYGLSSTLAFDFGVYLVVIGIAAAFLFALMKGEDETWRS